MKVIPAPLEGVVVLEPVVHSDDRGFFLESYQAARYRDAGVGGPFVQDNHSRSKRGTLRGLHAQRRKPQGKLLRVIEGEIFDVAVDVRRGSPTFARWFAEVLSAENFKQIWVPPGFVHGFVVLSESAQVEYKCTDYYDRNDELGVLWNDPEIGIAWPIPDPLLSPKDRELPRLKDVMDLLPAYSPALARG